MKEVNPYGCEISVATLTFLKRTELASHIVRGSTFGRSLLNGRFCMTFRCSN